MHDPKHPIWAIIRTTIILIALTFVLWINASNFDDTEIRTIVAMFLAAIGAETATKFMSKTN
jgi:hypothetical protein